MEIVGARDATGAGDRSGAGRSGFRRRSFRIWRTSRWRRWSKLPLVAKHLGPLLERHRRSIEILRERCEARDGVIFFDVSDLDLEGYNKFIPYLLHPECVYSVSVSASAVRAKVSLGTNPWNQATADENLASLAEKYGGGGHPRVAAISFEPSDLERAREVARDLAAVLRKKQV